MTLEINSSSLDDTLVLGERLGKNLGGGEVIELISDLGGGKTALVRGLARGINSTDQVMSPTFTLSRIYRGQEIDLHHFDFYRLSEPGVMASEFAEILADPQASVVVEWGEIVQDILSSEHLRVKISVTGETERMFYFEAMGKKHQRLLRGLA